jgi:hypothetical protein
MSSWLKDGHTTVPDPELERADLVHLCMVIIRIELSMSRTESAIRRWQDPVDLRSVADTVSASRSASVVWAGHGRDHELADASAVLR